jgi:hypothetical protein
MLSAASIGVVAVIASLGSVEPDTLWFEIAKTLLQVGVVLAIGALLSLLTSDYQREQQRAESRQELLRDLLARATTAYNDVKRARRLLRGKALIQDGTAVLASAYDEQIAAVNDAQLQFETMADEVQGAFPGLAGSLAIEFDAVEESLNALVREYEDNRPNFDGEPLSISMNMLPALRSFLEHPSKQAGRRDTPAAPGFAPVHDAFHRAQRMVWDQFLHAPPVNQTDITSP